MLGHAKYLSVLEVLGSPIAKFSSEVLGFSEIQSRFIMGLFLSLPLGLLRELSEKADAARAAMHGKMDAAKGRVAHAAMLCGSLSPYSVLARGYSIARKAGSVLKSSADASEGDRVEVQLAAGRLGCRVETIITEEEL
mgnify:CR=1 FL=1